MLHSLTLTQFGVHQARHIEFGLGVTAISGRNDTGKSLLVEAVRYALFGVAALRDDAPPLSPKASVDLVFSVRDEQYRVTRTPKGGTLKTTAGQVLAVGTKPINLKIIELFGYGLEVFDVANCANQGLIEALSNMRPAERKRMVETTLGMDALEQLTAFCRAEAMSAGKEADALARGLGPVPDEPVALEGGRSAEELGAEVVSLRGQVGELRELELRIARRPPAPSGERPELAWTEETFKANLEAVQDINGLKVQHKWTRDFVLRVSAAPPAYSLDQVEERRKYVLARSVVADWPMPAYSVVELGEMEKQINLHEDYHQWARLNDKGHISCPSCHHQWPVEADKMKQFPDFKAIGIPLLPSLTIREINSALTAWRNRKPHESMIAEACATTMAFELVYGPDPSLTLTTLELETKRIEEYSQLPIMIQEEIRLSERLAELEKTQRLCIHHQKSVTDLAVWESQNADFVRYQAAEPGWRESRAALLNTPDQLTAAEQALVALQVYTQLHANWVQARDHHARVLAEVGEWRAKAEGWKAAVGAINEVRAQIEKTFVPGLAQIASVLIQRMTGGQHRQVAIDPGFALTLDGQGVGSLSGSLKAVANLALRIGLGRMLTARVFSVLILDEPDAAMDGVRASATAECLRSLCPDIAQVVLVTHKSVEADHQYVLS